MSKKAKASEKPHTRRLSLKIELNWRGGMPSPLNEPLSALRGEFSQMWRSVLLAGGIAAGAVSLSFVPGDTNGGIPTIELSTEGGVSDTAWTEDMDASSWNSRRVDTDTYLARIAPFLGDYPTIAKVFSKELILLGQHIENGKLTIVVVDAEERNQPSIFIGSAGQRFSYSVGCSSYTIIIEQIEGNWAQLRVESTPLIGEAC